MSAIGYCTLIVVPLVILQDVIWPRGGGLMSPLLRGHWLNNLQSGSHNLHWRPRNGGLVSPLLQGCILNNLHSTAHTPYATIFQCRSGLHPWKGCGQWCGWLIGHPWKWHRSAGIRVSLVVIPLLLCLCPCRFCLCYFVKQITNLCQCVCCLCIAQHRTL